MFRSPSFKSILHRDNRHLSDKSNDQYSRLEELASEFSMIRKEIHNDSEHYALLHLSQIEDDEAKSQQVTFRQIQDISDRRKSLSIPLHQPVKGNYVQSDKTEKKAPGVTKNLLIPRVNRLAGLSSELRSISERVLAKDNSDVSVSNMSGATELTVPSCASWDGPHGSFHCVITQAGEDITSLSKSTETSEDDSNGDESPSPQVPLVQRSILKAPMDESSSMKLTEENSLLWSSSSMNIPIFKQVGVYAENCTNSNNVAQPHNPEPIQGNVQASRCRKHEGFCLSECQPAPRNSVTVLATPTIVQSLEGPTRTLEVLQLQYFPIVETCASQGNSPTNSTFDDDSRHSSCDKNSMVTNQPQSVAVTSNLSKPPRHPLTKPVVKDTQDHRETIMAGFSEWTTNKPKTTKKSKPKQETKTKATVSVAEIEALLDRENQENLENNNRHGRSQSIPSVNGDAVAFQKDKHRRVHSYDAAKISTVISEMEDPRKASTPKFRNSHEIFRQHSTSAKTKEMSERRSERSTRRSGNRRRRSHSSSSRRSSRSLSVSDEQEEAIETMERKAEKKSGSDCGSSRNSLDSLSRGTCHIKSEESVSSRSQDHQYSLLERANKSTCTNICGIIQDDGGDLAADVDMVLREIRKRQIDRMIATRVGATPLGISMTEERLLQRIYDRSNGCHTDDSTSSSPSEGDNAFDVASYRSRRHGVAMINTLRLRRDVTPTRRMEQRDMDHVERRRFLEDFKKEVSSIEKREKRRRSVSRSIERQLETRSHKGDKACSETTSNSKSLSSHSRRSSNKM